MSSLFNLDNPVFKFLSRLFDMLYLNLLCLLCCAPIITIGPSITALYYCMMKISRDRDSSITGMFFHSFKMNLKQGCLMTVIFISYIVFFLLDIQACNVIDREYMEYIKIIIYVIFVLFVVVVSYAFPLLAQFNNTIKNTIKNAFIIAFLNLGYTCVIVFFNAIPIVFFVFVPELFMILIPLWFTFGFSGIALINSRMFVKIFDKLISQNHGA